MNNLKGNIKSINNKGSLSIVDINVGNNIIFKTIIIESPKTASYLIEGHKINVIFKETEVVIGKGVIHPISMQNKVVGTILNIEKGELLSKVTIDIAIGKIVSIITTSAVENLELSLGEEITAMIKTNEIMLSE